MVTRLARLAPCIAFSLLLATAVAQADLFSLARTGTATEIAAAVDAGADLDAVNDDGDTALLVAVTHNTRDVVEVLLDAGADPQYKNPNSGHKIFALASRNPDSSSMYRLFSERGLVPRVDGNDIADAPLAPSAPVAEERAADEEGLTTRGFNFYMSEGDGGLTRESLRGAVNRRIDLEGEPLTAEVYANACKGGSLALLKAPATASFGDETRVSESSRGVFTYRTHVDAQNGFGALIRSRITCYGFFEDGIINFWIDISSN